jgi:hypothetical protein
LIKCSNNHMVVEEVVEAVGEVAVEAEEDQED